MTTTTASCIRPCAYLDGNDICCYYLETGIRRPCPAGADCTVRQESGKMKTMGKLCLPKDRNVEPPHVTWDTKMGLELWLKNWRTEDIAREVGIARSTLNKYAVKAGWPHRKVVRKSPEPRRKEEW